MFFGNRRTHPPQAEENAMKKDTPLDLFSDLLLDYMSGKHTKAMLHLTGLDPQRLEFVHGFAHWLDAITSQERLDRVRAMQSMLDDYAKGT